MDMRRFTEDYLKPLTDISALPLLHALGISLFSNLCFLTWTGYNRQIKTLKIANLRFQESTFKGLLELAKLNFHINTISLRGINLEGKGKGGGKGLLGLFFNALQSNQMFPLRSLDMQDTVFDEKACYGLAGYVTNMPRTRSLAELNLTGCILKANHLQIVLNGLLQNPSAVTQLRTLVWGRTKLGDASQLFSQFVAMLPALHELRLPDTGVQIPALITGLREHCLKLEILDLSKNKYSKESQWMGLSALLQHEKHQVYDLDVSETSIPMNTMRQLLLIPEGNVAITARGNNLYVSLRCPTTSSFYL